MNKKQFHTQILITIATAFIFFAVTIPFRRFFQVVSVTEVRPASAFNPLFGLIFGFPGAIGCAVGNLAADMISGYSPVMCVLGFIVQIIYGMLPHIVWKKFGCETRLNTALNVFRYITIMFVDSMITAMLLGAIMAITGIAAVFSMTTLMLFLNNFVFCMVLGIPILLIHTNRQIRKNNGSLSLNEKFILIFLILAILSATMIGFIAYHELSSYINDMLSLWNRVYIYIAINLFVFCVAIVCFIFYAEKNITIPMEHLAKVASDYINTEENGAFDSKKIAKQCDKYTNIHGEAGALAMAFRNMAIDIEKYITNFKNVTSEKERIGAELDVATHIQSSMLPCIFPAFPEKSEIDVYATMNPAKEVGGDFYDFFLVDDNHLAIVMADVSGKGVPAALFMVIAKTLIKNFAQDGLSPKEVFEKANNQLCENNEEGMFVTVWFGILELSTGKMMCANAGHEYPAIKRKDGIFELYKDKHGFVLAGMEDAKYSEYELEFFEGDKLFVYTDGATEATDAQNNLFGTKRMLNALNEESDSDCKKLLLNVQKNIDAFVGEAPQFDDITMLALEIKIENKIILTPDEASIVQAISFAEENAKKIGLSKTDTHQINIAVDEIYSNIVRYSGASAAEILFDFSGKTIKIIFSDNGKEYNPLKAPNPNITLGAEEREIGGLGIFIVRKSMDDMRYEYINGRNILTVAKSIDKGRLV